MDFDLFSCTFENLNSLKFNELQKLSTHYRVNKRWAKKREIIDKLLLLRDQEIQKKNGVLASIEKNIDPQENQQWIDGNKAFLSARTHKGSENDESDRRLTYNVSHPAEEIVDRRLTFNVVKNEESQNIKRDVNLEISDNIDRRLTYNADELKGIQRSVQDFRETCDASNKTDNVKVPETVKEVTNNHPNNAIVQKDSSLPGVKLLSHNENSFSNATEDYANKKEMCSMLGISHNQVERSAGLRSARVKMLTIPYSRIPAQKSGIKEGKGCDMTEMKLNEKIPAPKRPIKTRLDISKTPHTLQKLALQLNNKVTDQTKSVVEENNASSTMKSNSNNPSLKTELSTLDVTRRILPRRKSKTEDNVLVTKLKSSRNLKFFSPTESNKNTKRMSEPKSPHLDTNFRSKIPKATAPVETQKPLTAKKMPDFSKIHQRQFEQMDSILEYKRKKEERAKKLFGIPQRGIPVKQNQGNVPATVFQFKSSHNEKENQLDKATEAIKKPNQTDIKQYKGKLNRQDLMDRAVCKSNIVKNVKEQNWKHLNGVRTNKRFELQMKFRKI